MLKKKKKGEREIWDAITEAVNAVSPNNWIMAQVKKKWSDITGVTKK